MYKQINVQTHLGLARGTKPQKRHLDVEQQ